MSWNVLVPADDGLLINAPGQIRANWDALKLMTDSDLLITNAKCAAAMALVDTKLAQITTAGKVSGSAITSISSLPSGAGTLPLANIPGTLTGKSADQLDAQHGSYYRNANNINAGSLKHEYGGIEANISAIVKGGLIVGTGTGSMGIKAAGTDGQFIKYNSSVAGGIEGAIPENLSNVIYTWSGMDAVSSSQGGFYSGSKTIPNAGTGDSASQNFFMYRDEGATGVRLRFQFTKIAGISTVTIHARLWAQDTGASSEAILTVDIDGQSNTVKSVTSITPTWVTPTTIDVSGLEDETTYDGTCVLTNESSNDAAYCSAVTLIGS